MKEEDRTKTKTGIAIVTPYGSVWSDELFDTPAAAVAHLKDYWKGVSQFDLSKWHLSAATRTLRLNPADPTPILNPATDFA
jgi:hypothetical protein